MTKFIGPGVPIRATEEGRSGGWRRPLTNTNHDDYDTPEMHRLSQVFEAVKAAYPKLTPIEAMNRAQKIVDGGAEKDPERIELHQMALDWARDHPRADYREALLAVSRDYETRVTLSVAADPGRDLNAAALRYLDAHPGMRFRDALIAVDAAENIQTIKTPPYPAPGSAAKDDLDTQSSPLTTEEVEAYQKKHPGMTYKQALLELDKDRTKPGARAKS